MRLVAVTPALHESLNAAPIDSRRSRGLRDVPTVGLEQRAEVRVVEGGEVGAFSGSVGDGWVHLRSAEWWLFVLGDGAQSGW